MNKHFEDARYYLKRAGETATKGVEAELEPIRARFHELIGKEEAPSMSRLEQIQHDLKAVQATAEGEVTDAIGQARDRIGAYRDSRTE